MTGNSLKIALVQYTGAATIAENRRIVSPFLAEAVEQGADFIFLPEVANLVQRNAGAAALEVQTEETDLFLADIREFAASNSVRVHIGSIAVRTGDADGRLANRGILIDDTGDIQARYDKIHMFDVALSGGETYRESATYRPGDKAVLAKTPWGGLGVTICYDIRFPALYRELALRGARILTAPSSFTRKTGTAHWHTLLRARAIENGCFMIAAAQTGDHADGRKTFGHSLVVDPWGEVIGDRGTAEGVLTVDLDLSRVDEARRMVPSLQNAREFSFD